MVSPHGTSTVCLTFDFDAISLWAGSFGVTSPGMVSRGEFGAVGAERLLALLERYEIRSTWFVPGHTADTYPELVRRIHESGHELGHHGYCHENPSKLAYEDERRILYRGMEALEAVTSAPPRGYRSPAWDMSANTVELLVEAGFVYDSSLMGRDFEPYWCRRDDHFDPNGPYRFGAPAPLVEMPVSWHLDDFPMFEYVSLPNKLYPGLRAPDEVWPIWAGEFSYMRQHVPDGIFTLTMHPQVIGRGHRMLFLERFIEHLRAHEEVSFERMGDVAERWRSDRGEQ